MFHVDSNGDESTVRAMSPGFSRGEGGGGSNKCEQTTYIASNKQNGGENRYVRTV